MIHLTTGNILLSPAEALVNPVNTVGVMGKGLALQFKKKYPFNYEFYKEACEQGFFKIGSLITTQASGDSLGKKIINFPTAYFGR